MAPYLDAIRLRVDEAGVALDYAALDVWLIELRATDPVAANESRWWRDGGRQPEGEWDETRERRFG